MIDMSMQIGNLNLRQPLFLAAGPLTMKLENLIRAEESGVGAVDTKVTVSRRYPKTKCYERTLYSSTHPALFILFVFMWFPFMLYLSAQALSFLSSLSSCSCSCFPSTVRHG